MKLHFPQTSLNSNPIAEIFQALPLDEVEDSELNPDGVVGGVLSREQPEVNRSHMPLPLVTLDLEK